MCGILDWGSDLMGGMVKLVGDLEKIEGKLMFA
jgi:hypothetical protein